jgi:hypothetical protein
VLALGSIPRWSCTATVAEPSLPNPLIALPTILDPFSNRDKVDDFQDIYSKDDGLDAIEVQRQALLKEKELITK